MIKKIAFAFLWVIHVSALIGIALGYDSFFLPKSGYTLVYVTILTIIWLPVDSTRKWMLFGLCFITGMTVEWIGVHTGALFGTYKYLDNIGPKLDGIPYLIGVNWTVLVFITHVLSLRLKKHVGIQAALGAGLMVFLDYFLEQICAYAGFWEFATGAGWYNYLCWFIIAYILQLIAHKVKLKGDLATALNLYIVQLVFAAALWIIITT